jgi:hypothetical protein
MTTRSSDKLGIMFSEVMSGGFALDQTDPAAGAKAGKSQSLTMHRRNHHRRSRCLQWLIRRDLGRLDVRMDWAPFELMSRRWAASSISFTSGDPHLKLMVYEWPVTHEGKSYYFAGQKNVKTDPCLMSGKKPPPLHNPARGRRKTGGIIGAGI